MKQDLRIGIIGFDTSHVLAFTKLLNDATAPNHIAGARVVASYPTFSPDIESSVSRVEAITQEMREDYGISIVNSMDDFLEQVDALLLESVDGRRHLAEATPVIKARKPLFIDKPLAASYADAAAIVRLAKEFDCPLLSSSALRYDANIQAIKSDAGLGEVLGCDSFSPALLHPSNPGLFWYGIHAVEMLFTFMGTGCKSVSCHHNNGTDIVVGTWSDGRVGTVRGQRVGTHDYGVTVFGANKVAQTRYAPDGTLYAELLKQVIPFLCGAPSPIEIAETLEIMAFMEAALRSAEQNRDVSIKEITEPFA